MSILLNKYSYNPKDKIIKHYVLEKEVQESDSLYELAISVMKESGVKEYKDYIDNNRTIFIGIFVKSESLPDLSDGWGNESQGQFGIKYCINPDGTIKLLKGYEPLKTDITFSELREIIDSGYIDGDYHYLIIDVVQGLGAGVEGLFQAIEVIGVILTLGDVSSKVFSWIKKIIHYRKYKKWKKMLSYGKREMDLSI